jgi:AraC-like DNA-binding protein
LEMTRSDGARFDPSWLRNALIALMVMGAAWAGFALADALDSSRNYFDRFWMYVGLSALSVYLGVEGWRNAGLPYPVLGAAGAVEPIEAREAAAERDWRAQGEAWAREIDAAKLWQDPDVTLASMARALGTNTTYVSRALNEGLRQSFSAFVNARRVEAVKAMLADPEASRDLMAVAFEAGFNSKASFNRAFSDFAGMSPSAFRKVVRGR